MFHPKFKTEDCRKFDSEFGCPYGKNCQFRHPDDSDGYVPIRRYRLFKIIFFRNSHYSGKKKIIVNRNRLESIEKNGKGSITHYVIHISIYE